MSELRHQLLITLVHGTWPRGLFPRLVRFKQRLCDLMRRRQPRDPPLFWFDEGSHFRARLSDELRDIPHKIKPSLWTGENSISERDKAAHVLAEHLSAEHAEHPQAAQLVVAHSHGGNIALRALHLLHQRDASRSCGIENAKPFVVTLATPFVEVHHADFGPRPTLVRVAVFFAIAMPLIIFAQTFFPMYPFLPALAGLAVYVIYRYWSSERAATRRQNKVQTLTDSTRFGEIASAQAQRLLIIRAIDDEATLSLALGTIANYVTAKVITYVLWTVLLFQIPLTLIILYIRGGSFPERGWYENAVFIVSSGLIFILLGLLSGARTSHGCELAFSPMECQINTQSAPDAIGLSKIVTLVRRTYMKSLRHGIYDHEDCAKTIVDWLRSQLCAS